MMDSYRVKKIKVGEYIVQRKVRKTPTKSEWHPTDSNGNSAVNSELPIQTYPTEGLAIENKNKFGG